VALEAVAGTTESQVAKAKKYKTKGKVFCP
jgi:hypothetical protein